MADGKGTAFELSEVNVGLDRDGQARLIKCTPGPPSRIDGLVIGAPYMTQSAPHAGEMHPDGDEILYLVSGRVDVVLEEDGAERVVEMSPGQGIVVPKGVWHRVVIREPSRLVHITPGPGGEHRPLPSAHSGRSRAPSWDS